MIKSHCEHVIICSTSQYILKCITATVDTHLITLHNSTEQSLSGKAESCLAGQNILLCLWNPKIYHSVHKIKQLLPNRNEMNSVHTMSPHFFKIQCNINPHLNFGIIGPSIRAICLDTIIISDKSKL